MACSLWLLGDLFTLCFSRPDLICLDVDAKGFLELCVVLTGTSKVTLGLFSHGFESRFASLSSVGLVVRGFLGTSIIRYLLSRLWFMALPVIFVLFLALSGRWEVYFCTVDENFRIDRRAYRSKPKWTKKHFCPLRCSIVIEHQPRTQVACLPRDLNRFFSLTTTPLEGPNSL